MIRKTKHKSKFSIAVLIVMYLLSLGLLASCNNQQSSTPEPTIKNSKNNNNEKRLLSSLSASEISVLLKKGDIKVSDYANALLGEAEQHSKQLNAFITIDTKAVRTAALAADKALTEALKTDNTTDAQSTELGPLFGIPIALKDLIVTKDLTTTFGTRVFADYTPTQNADLVNKLLAAGAIIFGKNNNQEWAFGSNGYNSHYGQQLNPYDTSRIAGGSSGGSAAAVAARIVPIAIGSDTAASIRVPAAYTGLYGLRPTTHRYSSKGVAPIAPTLDTVGPITRSVDDMALIDSVLSGDNTPLSKIKLSTLKLGVPNAFFHDGVSKEIKAAFNAYLVTLENAGVTLIRADLENVKQLSDDGLYPILFYETFPSVTTFLKEWGNGTRIDQLHAGLGDDVKVAWDDLVMPNAPNAVSKASYQQALTVFRPAMQKSYDAYFKDNQVDAIIFPATASVAPPAKPDNPSEVTIDGQTVSIFINDQNSSPGALAGQPGVVMPLTLNSEGLPIGVSLDGNRNADRQLLSITRALSNLVAPLPAPEL